MLNKTLGSYVDRTMSSKSKVMIIIDTMVIGGPGKGLFQLLRHADRSAFNYVLCNFRYPDPKSREFIDEARRQGINLRLLTQNFRFDPSPLREAVALAREEQCTIVQSHGYKSHLVAGYASRKLSIPWVAVNHGWTTENLKTRLYHSLDNLSLRRADVAVAVSPPLFQRLKILRPAPKRTELILNAIDPQELSGIEGGPFTRARAGFRRGDFVLGTFARLSPEKGHTHLFHALKNLLPRYPRLRLLLLGEGPHKPALVNELQTLGIDSYVKFLGYQSAMRDYYEALDLFVLPSLFEGLANVLLEAMSIGIPVIATRVGAAAEVITPGISGWLVPPADAEALATAIGQAVDDHLGRLRIARCGKLSLMPKFCPRARAARFIEIYQSLAPREVSPQLAESAPAPLQRAQQ